MIPILFRVGYLNVYAYGTMVAIALLVSDLLVALEFRRKGYGLDAAIPILFVISFAGVAGSRLYDFIDTLIRSRGDNPTGLIADAGFTFYGGLIGGILTSTILARIYRIRWMELADMFSPALALGYAIAKIGCHLAGDGDWGPPSTLPWATAYTKRDYWLERINSSQV